VQNDPAFYGVIYLVTNTVNGKVYIGQTTLVLAERWKRHCNSGKQKTRLGHAIAKHGRDAFVIEVIESCASKAEMNAAEIRHIAARSSTNVERGYNVAPGGGGTGPRTRESVERGADKLRGKPLTEETKLKLRAAMIGRKQTPEHVSAMLAGKARKSGFKHSPEAIAKMSANRAGKRPPPISDEHRAKLAAASRRYWSSEEAQQRRRVAT
jgi:group I intron endonuclease